ncbi:MAG TPA: hypothetical protein VHX42_00095 [Candidatus Babeliales bacterium]|jgi:hypothetical protein|nr:hypothetical protein [Candidatus Babeliales bacterium]
MTKKFLVIASLSTALMHGMETPSNWLDIDHRIFYNKTAIIVTGKLLAKVKNNINCIVVGYHEQNMLGNVSDKEKNFPEGYVYSCDNRWIYQKNRDIDDNPREKTLAMANVFLVRAVEPRIIQEKPSQHKKHSMKKALAALSNKKTNRDNTIPNITPITIDSKKVLAGCYATSLHLYVLLHNLEEEREQGKNIHFSNKKSIAFSNLGVALGFPREEVAALAVAKILTFIKKYPNVYDTIYFMVETEDERDVYRTLLEKDFWEKRMLLTRDGLQDINSLFSLLPEELILKILFLTQG